MRLLAVGLLVASLSFAEGPSSLSDSATLSTIRVQDEESSPLKRHEIIKTEVLRKETIDHKRAQTLAEAVSHQVGVDSQNSCANCGSKRVTINGLRGEHTTVLVDGVPMHSAISSIYGMDAIPVVGIDSIEVSRGAGASLVAPEAIGGVINIITARPTKSGLSTDMSIVNPTTRLFSALGSGVFGGGRHRLVVAGQLGHQGFWDVDGNGVAESTDFGNESFFVKGSTEIGKADRLEGRYARQTVGFLGGTVDGTRPTAYQDISEWTFRQDDVSKKYLDAQSKITDVIGLGRHEGMFRWNHFFPGETQFQLTGSAAEQRQDSIYMHGYDYRNRDQLLFADGRLLFSLGDSLFLTWGVEVRNEDMTSASQKLYDIEGLPKDDFAFQSRAAYAQGVWLIGNDVELSAALRGDMLRVNWLSNTSREFEIDQTLLVPRVHLKVGHGSQLTSRLMYGQGYRAPLSFFESQHGLNEGGFVVDIHHIETSHSLGYSLGYERRGLSITGSSHHTWISNLAYADLASTPGDAAVFRNYPGELKVWANDIVLSADVLPGVNLQLSYENFSLQPEYKRLLPAAAIENRIRLVSDWHFGNWEFVNMVSWVAPRDLGAYGYGNHFRTLHDAPIVPGNPGLGNAIQVNQQKNLQAPGYLTWDLYLGWNFKQQYTFFASVQNVLNFTQTGYGDSPLNWASHGGDRTHFHLDNNHTWGPLRGRMVAVGFKAAL